MMAEGGEVKEAVLGGIGEKKKCYKREVKL